MNAIVVDAHGGPEVLRLRRIERPVPPPGHALVRIEAAGVNFIDVYERSGVYPTTPPFIPGNEGAGTIVELGADATGASVGDRVAFTNVRGTFAAYTSVPVERLVPVPAGLSSAVAAAALLQGMTAHYLVHSTCEVREGDTVLIHAAAGGVGLLLCQMARRLGARVIGTVSTEEKAALARTAGATDLILYTRTDFLDELRRLTGGRGADVVYDSVGKDTCERSLRALRPRGMLVLFGGSSGAVPPVDPQLLSRLGSLFLTRPSLVHYVADRAELLGRAGEVFDRVRDGTLAIRIDREYPLGDARRAFAELEGRRTAGKLLLIPD